MAMIQLPLSAAQHHRNRQLFSDYYLNVRLPQRPEWRMLLHDARPVMEQVRQIVAAYLPGAAANEAQTEEGLVKPILRALGHTFEVQTPLRTPDGTKKPDYVLYRDQAALLANRGVVLDEERLVGRALAVADAKQWDRPLDIAIRRPGVDPFNNKNPSYQIAFYIQHSGLRWGILTNGRLWRLYHRDTAHKLDRFYEVDLVALLHDDEAFLYFYAFFHRSAFDEHPLGVEALRLASADYARGVGDTLKAQVYDALRHLAQGFLDYPSNGLAPDPATLREIYDNALIVLYRLLFVLYAEARGLLPLRESETYREEYSLEAIKREVARTLDTGRALLPTSGRTWQRLRDLWAVIDQGSPPLKVATYNGGLFDPARHPFLEHYGVGDAHLQQAIDKLTRAAGEYVDYRDLEERHLGTIYEGLLEYHLQPIPREGTWTVALLNDRGERRATGSYYTPDYIVKYIVDQTVGPVLRAAVEGLDDAARVAAVLGCNVLDPAMGSGHFLVEATEYIARFLVDLAVAPGADAQGEGDLQYWKRRVVQSCIYGVDLNPLAVELAKLSLWLSTVAKDRPLSFLDHHLRTGNSLVGARIADLRVSAAGAGAARRTRKEARQAAAGQMSMLDDEAFRQSMSTAVSSMWLIEGSAAHTVAEVKEQERVYADLRGTLTRRYGRLADLVTATHFGLRIDPTFWQPLADYATGRTLAALPKLQEWLDRADAIAEEQRFFHWELEFPEIFFDRNGQPLGEQAGFDAVVGNPPYVRQEQVAVLKPYLASAHHAVYDGVADLYVYFYHQGLELLRTGGRLSYIVTNKWLRAGYGEPLRGYFAGAAAIERIVDFGHAPIFEDADTFPSIVVLSKRTAAQEEDGSGQTLITLFPREALNQVEIASYIDSHNYVVPSYRFDAKPWSLERPEVDALMARIRKNGIPLREFLGQTPAYGIKTGLNEAFLVDTPTKERLIEEDPRSAEIIRPYLRGQDIKRWTPAWAGLWMILLKSSGDHPWPWSDSAETTTAERIFAESYPSIYRHMKPWEEKLRKRQDKGQHWWELRSCSYYSMFSEPTIIHTDITWRPQFAFVADPMYLVNTAYMWPTADLYLLAVVNSPLLWSYMWRNAMHGKDEALRLIYSFVENLPIAPPDETTRSEAELAVSHLITLTKQRRAAQRDMLTWLQVEFEVQTPGQRLEAWTALDDATFVEEVRGRRPRAAGRLGPGALRTLRDTYLQEVQPILTIQGEEQRLERRLAELVNDAYGLTPEEVDLLWQTAPPRMPVGRP